MWFIFLISGIIAWTFAEYMLHRFLGHVHKGKNFFKAEHLTHHSRANYFAPAYKKVLAAVVVGVLMCLLLNLLFTFVNALSFVAGFTAMYFLYEVTHKRYHSKKPLVQPFIILRKHHFYHHFHNPNMNHGVATRFWDRVFKTFHRVEVVKVPKQMSMDWLLDGNDIKPAYANHFQLGKR
jgi:sterol desaturase/sphingolipid hydroxylase (fatty acid hydroxylase superfamily)